MKALRLGFLGVLFLSMNGWAGSVFVGSIKGVAVTEADTSAVEELVKTSVVSELKESLVDSADGADYIISGKLVKLGEAYSLTLVKSKNAKEISRATLKASMMSDMDVVVGRLVRAVDKEVSAGESESVKDVTYDEEKNQRRRKDVLSQFTFAVGPASTSHMNVRGQTTLWNIGYNYELENDWDMHVDVDGLMTHRTIENDAYYAGLNFGVNRYLTLDKYSPFIEGHIGYAMATVSQGCSSRSLICISKDKASGWIGGFGVGMRFFRTSKTNFAILLRGSFLSDSTSISQNYPSVGSIMIVGYFN